MTGKLFLAAAFIICGSYAAGSHAHPPRVRIETVILERAVPAANTPMPFTAAEIKAALEIGEIAAKPLPVRKPKIHKGPKP